MKIAVYSTPIFKVPVPGYSGLEVIAYEQAKGLAARGHDVLLIAPDGSTCPGVQIVPCGPAGQMDEKMAYGGCPEHKDGDKVLRRAHAGCWQALLSVDVVLDHSWSKRSYALKAEGRLKAPVLGWMHAPVNTMFGSWPPAFPRLPPVDRACPVCISEDQASHFRALHNRDVRVCYNGFDPEVYKPIPGIKRTDRFLFMGRFSTVKSPHIAIEACLKAGVGLDVVGDRQITGEPHYYDHCCRLAQQQSPDWDAAKQGKQIMVHPGCTRGETVTWYSRAHAFLHSAKDFREPFGLAPVEAQACGLPVVCFDNGALRETVIQDRTGAICKTEEEFLQAITSPWLFNFDETDRAECRKNALRFTVENMINRVEELCKEAVKTGGW